YVNDEVDVVGRAFMGLSVACARCHDHKFDPISTQDYYALAGIFFSTRIVPGPVPGNTPLVRVPLMSPAELARIQDRTAAEAGRRAELERLVPGAAEQEYRTHLAGLLREQSARYLVAACAIRKQVADGGKPNSGEMARQLGLHDRFLAEWIAFLGRIEKG